MPESIELTTAGATKLFDIIVQAAPEIIAAMPKATACMTAGVPAALFGTRTASARRTDRCLQGATRRRRRSSTCCNNVADVGFDAAIGQTLAVATLMCGRAQLRINRE